MKKVLEDARQKSSNVDILKAYERVVRLYKKHNMPTDDMLQSDLQYYTALLLEDAQREHLKKLLQGSSSYTKLIVMTCLCYMSTKAIICRMLLRRFKTCIRNYA